MGGKCPEDGAGYDSTKSHQVVSSRLERGTFMCLEHCCEFNSLQSGNFNRINLL